MSRRFVLRAKRCTCGHARETHEHYRRGNDCGACACTAFHGVHWLGRLRLTRPGISVNLLPRPRSSEDEHRQAG